MMPKKGRYCNRFTAFWYERKSLRKNGPLLSFAIRIVCYNSKAYFLFSYKNFVTGHLIPL